MSAGAPTRCGPARRNGRSRRCAAWRSPRRSRSSTASRRWARRRPGEERDPRRQQRAPVRLHAHDAERGPERQGRVLQVALREARRGSEQPRVWLHQQGLAYLPVTPHGPSLLARQGAWAYTSNMTKNAGSWERFQPRMHFQTSPAYPERPVLEGKRATSGTLEL